MEISPARVWRERGSRYRLEGSRCKKCGKYFYPPNPVCPFCRSREVEKVELPKRGRVLTWIIEHTVPEGYREFAPLIIALIELENGAKILAPLVDVSESEIRPGMEVEATVRLIYEDGDEGVLIYGVKFRPIIAQLSLETAKM